MKIRLIFTYFTLEYSLYSITNEKSFNINENISNEEQIKYYCFHPVNKNFIAVTTKNSFELFIFNKVDDDSDCFTSSFYKELPNMILFKWNTNGE